MEAELKRNLFKLVEAFSAAKQLNESTIGRMSASDGRFFSRVRHGKTFTVKKYDEMVDWFAVNWPGDLKWPDDVPRPEPADTLEAAE